jgi:hypothetical protein
MSIKKSIENIGNRTRDLPGCCSVPQPTALPRAPESYHIVSYHVIYHIIYIIYYRIVSYRISYHISYNTISYHIIYHLSYHISFIISYHIYNFATLRTRPQTPSKAESFGCNLSDSITVNQTPILLGSSQY